MEQIDKLVLNSSIVPQPVYRLFDSIHVIGFVVPSLLSVIRQMTKTRLIFYLSLPIYAVWILLPQLFGPSIPNSNVSYYFVITFNFCSGNSSS